MYIKEIYIGAFGALKDRNFAFGDGINLIEGANEAGKSTLCAFIKFIFFGLPGKAKGAMPDRKRYLPFDGSSAYGTLTLCTSGREYRISRTVAASGRGDTYEIIDCANGEAAFPGVAPCDAFLHMSEGLYTHTAYVPQLTGTTVEGTEVTRAIENLLFSAEEEIDSDRTLALLDRARAELLHKSEKGGRLFEERAERAAVAEDLRAAQGARASLAIAQEQLSNLRASEEKNDRLTAEAEAALGRYECAERLIAFDEAKKLTERRQALEEKRAGLIPTGGLPGQEDIHALVRLAAAIDDGARALEHARADAKLPEPPPENPIEADGGSAAVTRRLTAQARCARVMRVCGAIALLCSLIAIAAGGCAAANIIQMKLFAVPLAGGAVGALIGLLLMISGASQAKKYRASLARYGVHEIGQIAERALRAQTERMILEKDAADRTAQLNRAREEQDSRTERARALCAQYDAQYDGVDSLNTLITRLTAVREAVQSIDADITRTREREREAYAALAGWDEEQLRVQMPDPYAVRDSLDPRELHNRVSVGRASRENQRSRLLELERAVITARTRAEHEDELEARLNTLNQTIDAHERRYDALRLAHERMQQAAGTVKEQISPTLAARAGELLAAATDGRYTTVWIGDDLSLSYADTGYGGTARDVDHLSRGTKDLAYLALRIALCELLCPDEPCPMIFDESFAALDDTRVRALFALIAARGAQSLLFTSQTRDRTLLDGATVIEL